MTTTESSPKAETELTMSSFAPSKPKAQDEPETIKVVNSTPTTTNNVISEEVVETLTKIEEKAEKEELKPNQTFVTNEPYNRAQSVFGVASSKVVYLVHWENTVHSGAALGSILAFLILTAYNSLFNILCVLALITIGCDWVYVLGTKQFKSILSQPTTNPHDKYLKNPPQISKETLNEYVDVWVDIINLSLIEGTKVVLIEDPLRSLKYVLSLYLTWWIASWFSFRTIITIAVITAFAVPKLYKQNQELVDQHVDKATALAKSYVNSGVDVVSKNTGDLIPKMQQFATSKGWIASSDATKKQS